MQNAKSLVENQHQLVMNIAHKKESNNRGGETQGKARLGGRTPRTAFVRPCPFVDRPPCFV